MFLKRLQATFILPEIEKKFIFVLLLNNLVSESKWVSIRKISQSIRQHLLIPGVEINAIEHKISLFADNVMIYSAGPKKHFTNLMQVLEKFNEYAGCKLNVTKTQMFNCKPSTELKQNYDIKWDAKRLKIPRCKFN